MKDNATQNECAKWAALTDARALGEPLVAEQTAFVDAHVQNCSACRAEAQAYQHLERFLDDRSSLIEAPASRPVELNPAWRRWAALAAGLLVFFVAGALLWPRPAPVVSTVPTAAAQVTLASHLLVNGVKASAGTRLHVGDNVSAPSAACLLVEPAVNVCLAAGSMVQVEDLTLSHRRLRLVSGRVKSDLMPQPPGTSFGIVTRDGESVAVGTSFEVSVEPGSAESVTRVLHGVVAVVSKSGSLQKVLAHQRLALSSGQVEAMSAAEETLASPGVDGVEIGGAGAPVATQVIDFDSEPAGASVVVDGRAVGLTPVSVLLPLGSHSLTVSRAGSVSAQQTLLVTDEKLPVIHLTMTQALDASAADFEPTARAAPRAMVTAEALLLEAKIALGQRNFGRAVEAFERLESQYPNSSEMRAGLLAHATLQLETQNDPASALKLFRRYENAGGALHEQALYGEIRALRALEMTAELETALRSFRLAFPDSALLSEVE